MSKVKTVGKIFLSIILVVLLASPVIALYGISKLERAQYNPKPQVALEELAYGDICPIFRTDIEQTVTVSNAQIISTSYKFQELMMYDNPYSIRFIVDVGDRVDVGDVIGYYDGNKIKSNERGIIKRISLGQDSYIMLESLQDLAIVCYVNAGDYNWEQENSVLKLGNDLFEVVDIEAFSNGSYGTRVVLTSDTAKLLYGEEYDTMTFSTGKVFSKALVVDARCVYSYHNSVKSYIRVVSGYGKFIQEIEVTPGYTNGEYICISSLVNDSIKEGMYCDAGYKAVVEGFGE